MFKIYLVSFAFFLSSCSFIDTKKETQNLSLASKHCFKTGGENIFIEKKSGVIGYMIHANFTSFPYKTNIFSGVNFIFYVLKKWLFFIFYVIITLT